MRVNYITTITSKRCSYVKTTYHKRGIEASKLHFNAGILFLYLLFTCYLHSSFTASILLHGSVWKL